MRGTDRAGKISIDEVSGTLEEIEARLGRGIKAFRLKGLVAGLKNALEWGNKELILFGGNNLYFYGRPILTLLRILTLTPASFQKHFAQNMIITIRK
jgi:hypothetical protein